ncbi:alpha/beta hydrolase [Nocardia flavorosea]|uniref:Alpha/beta hydrolase n=1 Tax=Nocardia flavorosea TaxID=53429 RepID=A0A846YL26_9NOCA|nr:alpha/beta hydrolase fold domain-containing protein [Nocardia flavorosea]NKY57908.1 alpha/beta hydrolase [Nocardia flavorosea]
MNDPQVRDRTLDGLRGAVPIREYLPAAPDPAADPLLWIHGGAFVSGGLDQHESHAVALRVAAAGRRVRTVDYALVPRFRLWGPPVLRPSENRYPAPLDDVLTAATDLMTGGRRIVIGGASAGGCLAASGALRLRDRSAEVPVGIILAYATLHAELPPLPDSVRARVRGRRRIGTYTPHMIRRMNLNYAGSPELLADPEVFPGGGKLTALPPVLLLDAAYDTLSASSTTFAGELTEAGVPAEHRVVPGTRHGFLDRPDSPGFRAGIDSILDWLGRTARNG